MTRLTWGAASQKVIHAGLDRAVLYPQTGPGIAWNGLVSIDTGSTPRETRSYFLDGQKVFQDPTSGDFEASVVAYTYPDILDNDRNSFGMSYRTTTHGENRSDYLIHILYNVNFVSSERAYATVGSSEDPTMFEFDIFSVPNRLDGFRPETHFTIDSRTAYPWLVRELENILYGSESEAPRLPDIQELMAILDENSILKITDHGDGTWSAEGPPVYSIGPTEFAIDWPSIVYLDSETYQVRSF